MDYVNLTLGVAFLGGLISFASPCVLPVVPAYLSVVTGLSAPTVLAGGRSHWRRTLATAGGFVAGFTTVFVLLGLSVTALGQALAVNRVMLTRVSGLVVVAMALFMLGTLVLSSPRLLAEARWRPDLGRFGPFAAPVAGAAFGLGWTPCIGPVLTSVLAAAASTASVGASVWMLLAYAAGLAVPFLAAALALDRLSGAFGFLRRHHTAITVTSALLLATFGLLLALNRMPQVTTTLTAILDWVGLGALTTLG